MNSTTEETLEERLARFGSLAAKARPRPQRKARYKPKQQQSNALTTSVHRGCPIEREFDDTQAMQFAHYPEHVKQDIIGSSNKVDAMELFLRSQGGWISNAVISNALTISHVNNIASQLRASLKERRTGEDVDARPITPTLWEYRICPMSESFRLRTENASRRPTQAQANTGRAQDHTNTTPGT